VVWDFAPPPCREILSGGDYVRGILSVPRCNGTLTVAWTTVSRPEIVTVHVIMKKINVNITIHQALKKIGDTRDGDNCSKSVRGITVL